MPACLLVPAHTMFCRAKPGFPGSLVARAWSLVWFKPRKPLRQGLSAFALLKARVVASSLIVAHPCDGMSTFLKTVLQVA